MNVNLNASGSYSDIDLANEVSPLAFEVFGSERLRDTANTTMNSSFASSGSTQVQETRLTQATSGSMDSIRFANFYLYTAQTIRNNGSASMENHEFAVRGFRERI